MPLSSLFKLKAGQTAITLLLLAPLTHATQMTLSPEERAHLATKSEITFCVDPQWMPFERITKSGAYEGIVADYMAALAQQLPTPLKLVPTQSWSETMILARERRCDIIPALNKSPERETFLNFTDTYLESAVVFVARSDSGYLKGFEAVEDKSLGLVKGYIFDELLQEQYPAVKRIYTASVRDAFRQVASGKLDVTVASMLEATRLIQEQGLSNLKIAGDTSFNHQFKIGIRNDDPVLTGIFRRLVDTLPAETTNQILKRWYTVKLQHETDYTLLYQLAAVAALLVGLLYYRSHRINQTRNQLSQLNNRLSDRNARLERLSQRDPLTGAYSRLKMSSDLQHLLNNDQEKPEPFALLMLDVLELRNINLQHGHTIGDLVLSEACQIIQENLPQQARLGRWDGDQFLVLLPEHDQHQAETLLDGLIRRLEQSTFSDNVAIQMRGAAMAGHLNESHSNLLDRLEKLLSANKDHPARAG